MRAYWDTSTWAKVEDVGCVVDREVVLRAEEALVLDHLCVQAMVPAHSCVEGGDGLGREGRVEQQLDVPAEYKRLSISAYT